MTTIAIFDQPIPGQSLTGEPKNNPWEQPAQMSDVEEVTMFYIGNMANQDVIDDLAAVCQTGLSLKPIVDTIVSAGNYEWYTLCRCRYASQTCYPHVLEASYQKRRR